MDQSIFEEAQTAYDHGDYRAAARLFLSSAKKSQIGNGAAYHMAGNALMRLRRYQDAVAVYRPALRDDSYGKRGAVQINLGKAYAALGEYSDAVNAYAAAIDEPDCTKPYKAWVGIASIEMDRGHIEQAAHAYRAAALDQTNPEAPRALLNLGLCFMALGRPADAVEAYRAALGFEEYESRGRALANLGQAYTALGQYADAVRSFEKAVQLHAYELSESARLAYETARSMDAPAYEVVDGWDTGEIRAPAPLQATPMTSSQPSGWDTGELMSLDEQQPAPRASDSEGGLPEAAAHAAHALGMGDDAAVHEFFSMTDEEMRRIDREKRRTGRSAVSPVRRLIPALTVVILLGVAVGVALWAGFGWPTQSGTVSGMMDAYAGGKSVTSFWVAVPGKDISKEMAKVPPVKKHVIEGVKRGSRVSTVSITVTPSKGAPLHYAVTLEREGVGWKVVGIENEWRSVED